MTSTITETIANQTCLFKQQIRILGLKTFLSAEDKDVYVNNITCLLNRVSDKLSEQAEVAKTYPQPDALRDLKRVWNLLAKIAHFDNMLEKRSDYLGRADLKVSVQRLIHAFYQLEIVLKRRAFSNKRCERHQGESAIALTSKPQTAVIKALFGDQSA